MRRKKIAASRANKIAMAKTAIKETMLPVAD
jgi:hypothetical protein